MSLPTLYELSAEYRQALEKLGELDLDDQTITDTLSSLQGDLQTKSQNVAALCLHIEALADAIKQAEAKMAHRRKVLENRSDNIREYIKRCMEGAGITKIECPQFKLQIKKNPPKTVIDDDSAVPPEFLKIPELPPPMPDKKAIAEYLKDHEKTEWAHLERTTRLDIS
jgi:hypothetical protein